MGNNWGIDMYRQFSEVGYSITENIKEKLCYYDAVIVIP